MAAVNPYLTFKDNCEEAFNFYKSVFGTEFLTFAKFKDMPPSEDAPPPGDGVMHVALPIGEGTVIMGSDAPGGYGEALIIGNNFSISINTESREEATRIFDGLSAGGQVTMPLNETFWGAFFGMFTDKFGIQWMVNHDINKQ